MNYFILRYILFFSVLNFSVAHSQNPVIINAGKSINNEKILDLTEIAGEITYVPLETSNESLISHIDKIKFFENNIFIETFNPERLLRFNKKGEFLNSIGREGRGPNEYATLGSFGINKSESEIYIYSVNPSKILIFDYEGKLKDQITINKNRIDHFHDIEFIPLTKFFILMQSNGFGNTPYSYHIYKEKSELVKKEIKPIQFKMNGSYTRNKEFSYYVVNNELFVKENLLNDTIYRVLPTLNFKPVFIFESGKYRCPVELRKNFMKFFMETDMKFVQLNNIYDCKNYLLFLFVFDKKKYFGFYNKILKKAYSFPQKGINNNYDGGLFFQPVYQLNNQLIGYFNAYDLIKHVRSEAFKNSTPKYPEKKKELEKLASSLDENDNPVLMLVKLKE